MTRFATSDDGTRIAFDRLGEGPPLILVSGMFCDRDRTRPLAEALAGRFTVITYDRRGRGESHDIAPYTVQREIEDLDALLAHVGGAAAIYGHSSGAGLALRAAAAGATVTRLALHEPPYGADDDESRRAARALADGVRRALAEDRRGDAIALFLTSAGMPSEVIESLRTDAKMQSMAPTMIYDHEVMGDFDRGGVIPTEIARHVDVPTLVLAGGASPDFFRDSAARLAALMPNAKYALLDAHDHGAPADVVAPVVAEFLAPPPSTER